MKLNKLVAGSAAAILLAATAFGVWAACGDSVCYLIGGELICVAEGPGGERRICTAGDPCSISCP